MCRYSIGKENGKKKKNITISPGTETGSVQFYGLQELSVDVHLSASVCWHYMMRNDSCAPPPASPFPQLFQVYCATVPPASLYFPLSLPFWKTGELGLIRGKEKGQIEKTEAERQKLWEVVTRMIMITKCKFFLASENWNKLFTTGILSYWRSAKNKLNCSMLNELWK